MAPLGLVSALSLWWVARAPGPLALLGAAYAALSLMYTPLLIVDRGMGGWTAIAVSWRLAHRGWLETLFLGITVALTAGAGVAFCGIGILATLPIAGCVLAVAHVRRAAPSQPPPETRRLN